MASRLVMCKTQKICRAAHIGTYFTIMIFLISMIAHIFILINLLILANRDSSTWMQYKLARDTRQHADNLTDSMNRSSYLRILKNTEEEI